jgi:hypothetical protein
MQMSESSKQHKFLVTLHEGADSWIAMSIALDCTSLTLREYKQTSLPDGLRWQNS